MKPTLRILSKLIPWVVIGAIGLFFYKSLMSNLDQLEGVSFGFNAWTLLGVVVFTLAVILSGVLWGRLLGRLAGRPVSTSDAVRIHAASWLLKYIPGQVGSYINKLAWGVKNGFSKKTVSTSFIYENVLMVIAGVALSVPVVMLFEDVVASNIGLFVPILVVLPMTAVFSRKVFYTLLNKLSRLIGKKPFSKADFLESKSLLTYQAGYLIPRLLNGVGFVFIVQSLVHVEPSMYIGLAATYILASIVGLLAIFVPGGIGVREAVIVALVSVHFPVEQAIVIALVARLYATIADIGVAIVYIVLNKGRIKQL